MSLALTVYAWQSPMKWSIIFKNSVPLPQSVSNSNADGATKYNAPFAYTPEFWNCNLAPYVVGPGSGRMQTLCQEAKVAKGLMIPLVILSALLVGLSAWMMWSEKRGSREAEPEKAKEMDEVSVETASVDAASVEAKN
jgi:hypothetical protein